MRTWDPALAAALADPGVETHLALAVDARDTAAGVVRPLGWWTGGWEISLPVDGVTRPFRPAGEALSCEDLEAQIGVRSRRYRVSLVGRDQDLSVATRDLDLAMAPVWLCRVVIDPADRANQWQIPLIKGWVDEIEARTGTPSAPGGVDLYVVTAAEALTWTLSDRRFNDATMRRRAPGTWANAQTSVITSGTIAIASGTERVDLELVGGGGGGAEYYCNPDGCVCRLGGDGGMTTVDLLDGSTVIQSWQALGGAGGSGCGSSGWSGASSMLSPYGDGGSGGSNNSSATKGRGGSAGEYLSIVGIDVAGLASPQLQVTIGSGGARGGSFASKGKAGAVVVNELSRTGPPDAFFRHASIASEVKRPW